MKLFILPTFIFLLFLLNPQSSYAEHIDLAPCTKLSHCSLEEWDVSTINEPLSKIQLIIENNPRTNIVEMNGDYIHAEVESRLFKFIDDLEVTYLNQKNMILIRSESRIGDGDFGVNKNRVKMLKKQLFNLNA